MWLRTQLWATRLIASVAPGIGRARGECVRRAMDIGVLVLVEILQPVDHRARLLRGVRVVGLDDRWAVDSLRQDRKIPADRMDIEPRRRCHGEHVDRSARGARHVQTRQLPMRCESLHVLDEIK